MGHPEKPNKSIFNLKNVFIVIFAVAVAVLITALTTYFVTRAQFLQTDEFEEQTSSPTDNIAAKDLRLPKSFEPVSYELTIKTYLPGYGKKDISAAQNLTFDGQVVIKLKVKESIRKLTFNSVDLNYNISKCSLTDQENRTVTIDSIKMEKKLEKVYINLAQPLTANTEVELKLGYTGPIRTDLSGLYQSVYTDEAGNQKIAAVTQMEPTDARKMVPCYDEPQSKANWTVTVIHPVGTTAISNGIEENESNLDEFKTTKFKTTPKMSSYLLAIFVSEFDFIEKNTTSGVRFRIWARPEAKNMTKYALEAGVKCLEHYEKYYGIEFPLEKQDMVAIPDFSAGAMENWGLITYRENALLYDENIYVPGGKRRVAVVIAHELAHQWFGNLVTMEWWDDLWLNEGFATLVEYQGTNVISDENFNMEDFFVIDALSNALDYDSRVSTHPLSFTIDKVVEVTEAFDSISYDKGGSVMRMLRKTIGEDNFQNGLQYYLKLHQYGNAKAADLFKAINEKTPENVKGPDGKKLNVSYFAEQWTSQLGYPLLSVERVNSTTVKVTQNRFKLSKEAKEKKKYLNPKYGFKWDVPVWYQQVDSSDIKFVWLKRDEDLFIETSSAVILNADSFGFYRVNYEENDWRAIQQSLVKDHEKYSAKTRTRLIEDAFRTATVGLNNYSIPVDLLEYLTNEKNFLPWHTAFQQLSSILSFYGTDPEKEPIEQYILQLLTKNAQKFTFSYVTDNYKDDKQFSEMALASQTIGMECYFGDENCVDNAKKIFVEEVVDKCKADDLTSQCVKTAAPLRSLSYCYGVQTGGKKAFDKVFEWYRQERVQKEKDYLMYGMFCVQDVSTIKKLLLNTLRNESDFRLQDAASAFGNAASNKISDSFLFSFLLTRWDQLRAKFDPNPSAFRSIILQLTKNIRSQYELDQLKIFMSKQPETREYNSFEKAIESAQVRIAWRKRNLENVSKIFTKLVETGSQ